MIRRTLTFAALAVLVSSTPLVAQPSFRKYVAVGDSLTAGFTNGSLVLTHQQFSWPALLAGQTGTPITSFQQPYITEPGGPAELALVSLSPLVIAPKATGTGLPANFALDRPYDNLAVPGATSVDLVSRTTGAFEDAILRGKGTQLQQAVSLAPTFVTLWIGSNDVLGAVTSGRAIDGVTMVPLPAFRAAYAQAVAALRGTGAYVVTATIPDVTLSPFANAIPPYVVNPSTGQPVLVGGQRVPLLGPAGPLPADSKVTLGASSLLAKGVGIPAALGGSGQGLPDEVVLDPAELAIVRDRVSAINASIREIAGAAGVPVLDLEAFTTDLLTNGRSYAGVTLDGSFLTGGLVGLDGIHPTVTGYAFVANEWIAFLNEQAGTNLRPVALAPFVFGTASSLSARPGASEAPALGARGRGSEPAAAPSTPFEFAQEAFDQLRSVFPPFAARP
jgi:lysophospholipase L1-like esterase